MRLLSYTRSKTGSATESRAQSAQNRLKDTQLQNKSKSSHSTTTKRYRTGLQEELGNTTDTKKKARTRKQSETATEKNGYQTNNLPELEENDLASSETEVKAPRRKKTRLYFSERSRTSSSESWSSRPSRSQNPPAPVRAPAAPQPTLSLYDTLVSGPPSISRRTRGNTSNILMRDGKPIPVFIQFKAQNRAYLAQDVRSMSGQELVDAPTEESLNFTDMDLVGHVCETLRWNEFKFYNTRFLEDCRINGRMLNIEDYLIYDPAKSKIGPKPVSQVDAGSLDSDDEDNSNNNSYDTNNNETQPSSTNIPLIPRLSTSAALPSINGIFNEGSHNLEPFALTSLSAIIPSREVDDWNNYSRLAESTNITSPFVIDESDEEQQEPRNRDNGNSNTKSSNVSSTGTTSGGRRTKRARRTITRLSDNNSQSPLAVFFQESDNDNKNGDGNNGDKMAFEDDVIVLPSIADNVSENFGPRRRLIEIEDEEEEEEYDDDDEDSLNLQTQPRSSPLNSSPQSTKSLSNKKNGNTSAEKADEAVEHDIFQTNSNTTTFSSSSAFVKHTTSTLLNNPSLPSLIPLPPMNVATLYKARYTLREDIIITAAVRQSIRQNISYRNCFLGLSATIFLNIRTFEGLRSRWKSILKTSLRETLQRAARQWKDLEVVDLSPLVKFWRDHGLVVNLEESARNDLVDIVQLLKKSNNDTAPLDDSGLISLFMEVPANSSSLLTLSASSLPLSSAPLSLEPIVIDPEDPVELTSPQTSGSNTHNNINNKVNNSNDINPNIYTTTINSRSSSSSSGEDSSIQQNSQEQASQQSLSQSTNLEKLVCEESKNLPALPLLDEEESGEDSELGSDKSIQNTNGIDYRGQRGVGIGLRGVTGGVARAVRAVRGVGVQRGGVSGGGGMAQPHPVNVMFGFEN